MQFLSIPKNFQIILKYSLYPQAFSYVFLSMFTCGVCWVLVTCPKHFLGIPKHVLRIRKDFLYIPKNFLDMPKQILSIPKHVLGVPKHF